MQERKLRILLAAEYPRVRHFLREVVEGEHGVTVVGQAANATKALSLARSLRPDVAIIDCYLPYVVGLDSIPLSRIGGLDTAQTISAEIPNTRVLIISNLNVAEPEKLAPVSDLLGFVPAGKEKESPLRLHQLYEQTRPLPPIVFVNINLPSRATSRQKVSDMGEKAIVFGGLAVLAGLSLTFSISLTNAGILLALVGGSVTVLGLAVKLAVAAWPEAISKSNGLGSKVGPSSE